MTIFSTPIKIVTDTLENNIDCMEMVKYNLPTTL